MAGKNNKAKPLSFEEGLEKLEALADTMEQGNMPLQQLLTAYEEGLALSAQLEKELEVAKARMMEVKQGKDGKPEAKPSQVATQPSLLDGLEDEQ